MRVQHFVIAKIEDVIPNAVYQGTVYDQRVVLEFENGTTLGAFDLDRRIDPSTVGRWKQIELRLLVTESQVNPIDHERRDVRPNPADPLDWSDHTYYGTVAGTDDNDRVILETEHGCVKFRHDEPLRGDIRVRAMRTDIGPVSE